MMDLFWMIFEFVVNLFQSAIVLQTIRAILKDKRTGKADMRTNYIQVHYDLYKILKDYLFQVYLLQLKIMINI